MDDKTLKTLYSAVWTARRIVQKHFISLVTPSNKGLNSDGPSHQLTAVSKRHRGAYMIVRRNAISPVRVAYSRLGLYCTHLLVTRADSSSTWSSLYIHCIRRRWSAVLRNSLLGKQHSIQTYQFLLVCWYYHLHRGDPGGGIISARCSWLVNTFTCVAHKMN